MLTYRPLPIKDFLLPVPPPASHRIYSTAKACGNWRQFCILLDEKDAKAYNHRSGFLISVIILKMIGAREFITPASKIVIVEGNIGAGKSTLCIDLAKKMNYKLFLEPTVRNPYLAKFYSEPKVYALKMQLWFIRQRYLLYLQAMKHLLNTGQGVLLDRSLYSDRVFADGLFADEIISNEGYNYYKDLRAKLMSTVFPPHVLIYLDAAPTLCHSRILSRGRGFESAVPLEYLENLEKCYKVFIEDVKSCGTHCVIYDWSKFGSTQMVADDLQNIHSHSWDGLDLVQFKKSINGKFHVSELMTLDYTINEDCDIDSLDQEGEELHLSEKHAQDQIIQQSQAISF